MICGFCAAVGKKPVMLATQRGFFTPDGAFSLKKHAERKWFWENLPIPPFVVLFGGSGLQYYHLAWKAPVTLDNRCVFIQTPQETLRVRVPLVRVALELCREIAKLNATTQTKQSAPKQKRFVPITLPSFSNVFGKLTSQAQQIVADNNIDTSILYHLSAGEFWVLEDLLSDKEPEPPAPISINQ